MFPGELAKAAPKNSLFSPIPIVSLLLQLIVIVGFQVVSVFYVRQQTDWFVPFDHENPFYRNTTAEGYYNATTIDRDEVSNAIIIISSLLTTLSTYTENIKLLLHNSELVLHFGGKFITW